MRSTSHCHTIHYNLLSHTHQHANIDWQPSPLLVHSPSQLLTPPPTATPFTTTSSATHISMPTLIGNHLHCLCTHLHSYSHHLPLPHHSLQPPQPHTSACQH